LAIWRSSAEGSLLPKGKAVAGSVIVSLR